MVLKQQKSFDTKKLTEVESIYNLISPYYEDIAWDKIINLVNLSFGAMVGGNIIKGIRNLLDLASLQLLVISCLN